MTTTHLALTVGAAAIAVLLSALGCLGGHAESPKAAQSFAKMSDMQPYVEPYPNAYILAGQAVETELECQKSPGAVKFDFTAYGTLIDQENYAYDDTTFRYVGNEVDTFVPGIPLLKFPLTVGDKWDWSGEYRGAGRVLKSTAEVTTEPELLKTVAGEFTTVRVDVQIARESGAKEPAMWRHTFWFAPKRGVVRREIEFGFVREPMPLKEQR